MNPPLSLSFQDSHFCGDVGGWWHVTQDTGEVILRQIVGECRKQNQR